MDLSKLPRLSKTDTPPPDQSADDPAASLQYAAPNVPRSAVEYEEPPAWGIEAWFSIGLGVVLLLLQPTMLQFVFSKIFGTHFGPYADGQGGWVDYATMLDQSGNVAATIPYTKTTPENSPNFWNDFVITAFALALVTEGAVLWLSRRAWPVLLTFLLTATAAAANLLYLFLSFKYGLALMSALAVLIGGYMAFSQWRVFRWRAATGYRPTARRAAAAAAAAARVDPAAQLVGRTLGGEPKARCTHYRFAHAGLRQASLENPARCVGILQTPGETSQKFLLELWEAVRAGCAAAAGTSADPADDAADGLEAETTQVGPYSAVVVRMPKPRYKGEAYFVGLVLRSYTRADGSTIERTPLLLYYTLEVAGEYEGGELKPAFCEWQAGDHVRFAENPEPTVPDFRAAMQAKVNELQKREDEMAAGGSFARP